MVNIGLDVDGVLRDMMTPFVTKYNEEFSDGVTSYFDVKSYDLKESFPSYDSSMLYEWKNELFRDAPRHLDTKGFVGEISRYGDVHIVSAQPFGLEDLTLEWLRKNEVLYESVSFIEDKSLLDLDYLVDDNPKNINEAKGVGLGVLRPWNVNSNQGVFMKPSTIVSYLSRVEGGLYR